MKYADYININKELFNMIRCTKNIFTKNGLLNCRLERIYNFLKIQIKDKEQKTVL